MKILDVQGFFLDKKEFFPKELALFDGTHISHYIFKPPKKYSTLSVENKIQIHWLENNFHGLKWSVGYVPLSELTNILKHETSNNIVYVKGLEKTRYIQNIVGSEFVEEYPHTEPALHKILRKPSCFYHTIPYGHCAIVNVKLLYDKLVWNK